MSFDSQSGTTSGASDPFEPDSIVEPINAMRRVIGSRLSESKRTAPHFYLSIDVALDAVQALRKQMRTRLEVEPPSINDFLVAAVGRAIAAAPAINGRIEGSQIRRFASANIGVAVALPDGGLVVPVLRNASSLDVFDISNRVRQLSDLARTNKLSPDDYRGGTFTVSNLGMFGIREFVAIINPPQAGILALGAAAPRPTVREGLLGIETMLTATLSADHRVVNGIDGARFLAAFKDILHTPEALADRPTRIENRSDAG